MQKVKTVLAISAVTLGMYGLARRFWPRPKTTLPLSDLDQLHLELELVKRGSAIPEMKILHLLEQIADRDPEINIYSAPEGPLSRNKER